MSPWTCLPGMGLEGVCLDDLSATIGRVQLKKLPRVIAARRKSAMALAAGCAKLKTVRLHTGLPHTQGVYWFLLLRLALDKLAVDKVTFVKALNQEGIPAVSDYWHSPTQHLWCQQRKVFGSSGYPWKSPRYKGDPHREYPLPNARATDATHILLPWHERCTAREVRDTLAALARLEQAYLK
ncbi:MAG: DegT/DnrJ/EryC1/StrS family aminotransferase [Phycisphaeraceae bacterium]